MPIVTNRHSCTALQGIHCCCWRNSQDLWTGDYHFIEVPHTAILGKRWCVNRFDVLAEWWSPHRQWAVLTGARPHQETKGRADVPHHRQAHRHKKLRARQTTTTTTPCSRTAHPTSPTGSRVSMHSVASATTGRRCAAGSSGWAD